MNSAALRLQIEQALSNKIPSALSVRPHIERERVPCGMSEVDALMQGGFPLGAITELVGVECSGRTTAALSLVSTVTRSGSVCAWVDVSDALDPETAAANGVNLDRLLWVRAATGRLPPSGLIQMTGSSSSFAVGPQQPAPGGSGSPHPRSEGRGMPEAIHGLLQAQPRSGAVPIKRRDKSIGTPGVPNRALLTPNQRIEQISSDRLPPRRGENALPHREPRCSEPQHEKRRTPSSNQSKAKPACIDQKNQLACLRSRPWDALDHALKATDLLLQAGGFSAIVLDLAGTSPEHSWRIPLATWFRFRAACERSRTILVLLTQYPCARSSAELVLNMQPGSFESMGNVVSAIQYRAEVHRQRLQQDHQKLVSIRKSPQRETAAAWQGKTSWAQPR